MEHHFDIDVAKEYGVVEAVLIYNFQYWIMKNIANSKHLHDGRHWTYNSQQALLQLFPYLSRQSLRTALQHLKDKGVIITGNYNDTAYDRTVWFAFADEEKWLFSNQPKHWLESTNGMAESDQPIPYNNTNNNNPQLSKDNIPQGGESVMVEEVSDDELVFETFRKAYKGTKRGLNTEFTNFKKKHKDWREVLPLLLPAYQHQQELREQGKATGCFVPQEKNLQTYLNQRCWEEEPHFEQDAAQRRPKGSDVPDWMTPEGRARQDQYDNIMKELWNS
jgi:hypothetical protein